MCVCVFIENTWLSLFSPKRGKERRGGRQRGWGERRVSMRRERRREGGNEKWIEGKRREKNDVYKCKFYPFILSFLFSFSLSPPFSLFLIFRVLPLNVSLVSLIHFTFSVFKFQSRTMSSPSVFATVSACKRSFVHCLYSINLVLCQTELTFLA